MSAVRLGLIPGNSGLTNEVICLATQNFNNLSKSVTVYFGGDVQEYPENMLSHRDHGRHLKWNLLNMASLLSVKFPSSHICIVKPKRLELMTFSCYDNFVESNDVGAPSYCEMNGALSHLKALLVNSLTALLNSECGQTNRASDDAGFDTLFDHVNLVGFSKGCVVLNQLITEAHTLANAQDSQYEELKTFWSQIRSIYWLDGGHSGGQNTWITDLSILNSLASFPDLSIYVHVTPYQVKDERRPWIGKECKGFVNALRKAKANIEYTLHFEEDEEASIETHFKVLEVFK